MCLASGTTLLSHSRVVQIAGPLRCTASHSLEDTHLFLKARAVDPHEQVNGASRSSRGRRR